MLMFAVFAALFSSCNSQKSALNSWEAYCVKYNINSSAPTEEEYNYYLDCWIGSVEEEVALGL